MEQRSHRARRSALYVPASNEKALAKTAALSCDCIIFDLEDAVAPAAKSEARTRLKALFDGSPATSAERIIRINPLSGEWGVDDVAVAIACRPDAILLPKVDEPRDVVRLNEALDAGGAGSDLRVWAMIETPRGVLNAGSIAEHGRKPGARLACLVAGTNDLVKDTGVSATPDRRYILPWLMQVVLAARAGGIDVLDGVSNDFRDLQAFGSECAQGAAMGFDGKTLIHPTQIEPANLAFSPTHEAVAEAEAIVAAFALPQNSGRGVISIDGRMVERLHLEQARRLLARR